VNLEEVLEQQILKELLVNEVFFGKVFGLMKHSHFSRVEQQELFKAISQFVQKYDKHPAPKDFIVFLQNFTPLNQVIFDKMKLELKAVLMNTEKIDERVLEKEAEEFIQKVELRDAILESVDIIQNNDDFSLILGKIEQALSIKIDTDLGLSVNDFKHKYEYYTQKFQGYLTGIKAIDETLGGGFREKTLSVTLAPSHGGKSAFLMSLASHYTLKKEDVLYFTLEMPEEEIGRRVDANLINVPANDIKDLSYEEYVSKFPKELGKLYMKEYSAGNLSVMCIKAYMKELYAQVGHTPKIIIIDYLALMKSDRITLSKAGGYLYYKTIAEELHGMAKELGVAVITAQQLGRQAFDNLEAGADDVSDSIGVIQTADIAFGLLSTELLRNENKVLVNFWKNRYTGKLDKYTLNVDYGRVLYWSDEDGDMGSTPLSNIQTQQPTGAEAGVGFGNFNFGNM
jgi:replicative DNA helicase